MITVHQAEIIAAATENGIVHLNCFNGFTSDLQRHRALSGYTSAQPSNATLLTRFDVDEHRYQDYYGDTDDEPPAVYCEACGEEIE